MNFKRFKLVLENAEELEIHCQHLLDHGKSKRVPDAAFIVYTLFDNGHSDWCEVISHCSFDLHFSNNEQC